MTGARIDRDVIRRRLGHILDAVDVLSEYRMITVQELTTDVKRAWAIERGLQLCVQAVLDIAAHIVAASGSSVGDEYRDHIVALGQLNVLPAEFAERIAPMAGFRNILVHEYLDVDVNEVHRALTDGLDDLIEFARWIELYLERTDP